MKLTSPSLRRRLILTLVLPCVLCSTTAPPVFVRQAAPTRRAGRADAAPPPATAASTGAARLAAARAREAYGRIALSFEANRGQAAESIDFLARGAGYALYLRPTEAVFALARRGGATVDAQDGGAAERPAVLRMKLVGADAGASAEGSDELAGKVNYFSGDDPARWRTNVPTFGRVRYGEVYPGIDLVYYGNQRQLEYDFVVAPGSDARAVKLDFEGADKIEVDAAGDLLLSVGEGVIRQPKPFVYQEVAGARRAVEGGYLIGADGRVGFALGEYDPHRPLVIDPVLVYSTYLGGSVAEEGRDIAVDSAGNAYVCGNTASTNFPTANAFQATFGGATFDGGRDAFVAKLNAAGSALVYSTYLGGGGDDRCGGIAVDSAGNAYVGGETTSTNFPTANGFQNTFGGGLSDAFVTKLNAAGSALVYSTYLGGNIFDAGQGMTVDSAGSVYLTGRTTSDNFPTVNPFQAAYTGGPFADAFVTKFNAAGSALVYSTYLGGTGFEAGFNIAADSAGNAYVTGQVASTNFPTVNPVQATFGGGFPDGDAFVTKLNAAGSALVYSTYLGGSDNDVGTDVAVDSAGSAYVSGFTFSNNFPTANAFQGTFGGGSNDGFVTKLNAAGSAFVYSTYLGGSEGDACNDIAVDSAGRAHIAGGTASTNFPIVDPVQATSAGGIDAFVTRFNAAGSALVYSTYFGGGSFERGNAIALDSAGSVYVIGLTSSTDFPTLGPIQGANAGAEDAFVFKLAEPPAAATLQFSQAAYPVQEDITFVNFTVTRTGDTSTAVNVDYATADGTANERGDYTTAVGTIRFAAGQTEASVPVLISEDSHAEGPESFTVMLSNPTGGASLGAQSTAAVQIADDAVEPSTNVNDDSGTFVGQHYHDFLNRQHDADGLAFWTNQIEQCGADTQCREVMRVNVSAAFFLSIEFQKTGYEVIRIYKSTFTDMPQRPRGLPRYREFLRDTQEVGRGVVVGVGDWEQQLQQNMLDFARAWVQRADFVALFPAGMTAEEFVDRLFQNAEVTPTQAERAEAIAAFGAGGVEGRAAALLSVVRSGSVFNRQFNPAVVLMQYFGYLRRSPDDPQDINFNGFLFWLNKLDSFSQPGEDVRAESVALRRIRRAEMVRAFLVSIEYRARFGQ